METNFYNNSSSRTYLISSAIITGLLITQNLDTIKSIASKVAGIFFRRIDIPLKSNQLLFPKLQTFLKRTAIGGNHTLIENGNSQMLTGPMITYWPTALVYISTVPEIRAKIFLHRFGPSTEKFLEHLVQFNNSDNLIRFYTLSDPTLGWQQAKTIECVKMPLLYDSENIEQLNNNVKTFLNSKLNNQKLGKTHKLTVLLGGPAGCGKTTLIKWLAMNLHRNVYILDPSCYFNEPYVMESGTNLKGCEGGILLFEDIDRYFADLFSKQDKANISKFLNFLDGLCTPDDIIIALTANYEGDIPDVIRRDGRIDLTLNLSYVTREIVEKTCNLFQVDSNLIDIEGDVTTSNLMKRIENNLDRLQRGETIIIRGTDGLDRAPSNGSIETWK